MCSEHLNSPTVGQNHWTQSLFHKKKCWISHVVYYACAFVPSQSQKTCKLNHRKSMTICILRNKWQNLLMAWVRRRRRWDEAKCPLDFWLKPLGSWWFHFLNWRWFQKWMMLKTIFRCTVDTEIEWWRQKPDWKYLKREWRCRSGNSKCRLLTVWRYFAVKSKREIRRKLEEDVRCFKEHVCCADENDPVKRRDW